MVFQAKFAIITPALIAGAFAERIKFSAFVIFIIAWSTIVYTPAGALDVGDWRLAGRARRPRFRRGRGGPHQLRGCRFGCGNHLWSAPGARSGRHGAPQRAFCGVGGCPALVWLVWLQRRQRPGLGGKGHLRLCSNPYLSSNCLSGLGCAGLDSAPKTQRRGSGDRSCCRLGNHHPSLGVRGTHACSGHWAGRWRSVLHRRLDKDPCEA